MEGRMSDAYENEIGEPVLRPSLTLFIDSLGTRSTADGLTTPQLRDLLHRRSKCLFMLNDADIAHVQRTLMFTDNIVVGHTDDSDLGSLRTCFNGAAYQLGAALAGQFQRGGMAFGLLYMGDGIVHSRALIDAYNLERDVANFPRIVLSPGIRRRLLSVAANRSLRT